MKQGLLLLVLAMTGPLAWAQQGYADLVESVQDAVVFIENSGREDGESRRMPNLFEFFEQRDEEPEEQPRRQQLGTGSGFVISEDGYIVTNRHVVDESETVTIRFLDEREFEGRIVGLDDSLDVALIKIEAKGLRYLKVGDSKRMRIGDALLAMGYPLDLGFSVTSGIVSGFGRNMRTGSMDLATYIQTDADISFGNSGGPLVNVKGEVVGINTMIITRGGNFTFAIPSELFAPSIEDLKSYGRVRRGALGISVSGLPPNVQREAGVEEGALIADIFEGMPAAEAGLKIGDIILEIDGKKVRDSADVVATVSGRKPGEAVRLQILSGGRKHTASFVLGERTDFSNNERRERRREGIR